MVETFNLLKDQIKKHPDVLNSLLNYSDVWKTAHYNQLSDIINQNLKNNEILQGDRKFELGTTISAITLKRFFEHSISTTATNDLRFIKTLDKLSIFLGFVSFNDFISRNVTVQEPEKEIVLDDVSEFELLITKVAQCEYDNIMELPTIKLDCLLHYVHLDSPYYLRVKTYIENLSKRKMKVGGRPTNYQIYNLKIINTTSDLVVVGTSEFWNLNFFDGEGQPHHYHILNDQHYFIKKIDGVWKIWDNYNPNVWELSDKI